jgi:hypothetical protein
MQDAECRTQNEDTRKERYMEMELTILLPSERKQSFYGIKKARVSLKSLASEEGDEKLIMITAVCPLRFHHRP